MGFLFILLGVMILTVAIIAVTIIFNYQKNKFMRKVIAVCLVSIAILGSFAIAYSGIVSDSVAELTTTYKDLALYQGIVEESSNEYVRYDFYDKVTDYNEEFTSHQVASESKWLGALYPKDWEQEVALIDFELHGDNYAG